MPSKTIDRGPISLVVAGNVRRLREVRNLSLTGLSAQLARVGRPIQASGLHRVEQGDRRVDVDDLVALALALGVGPSTLLLPPRADDTPVELTPAVSAPAWAAWQWCDGDAPLPTRGDDEGYNTHEEIEDWEQTAWPPERRRRGYHPAMRALDRIRRAIAREQRLPPAEPGREVRRGGFKVLLARLDAEIDELFTAGDEDERG